MAKAVNYEFQSPVILPFADSRRWLRKGKIDHQDRGNLNKSIPISTDKEATMLRYANFFLILLLAYPFDGYALEMEREEILQRPSRPYVEHIFLEQESISAYFEVTHIDEYKNLIPSMFSMPEKPLCMVKINNFYKMESAPPYLEAIVQILVKFRRPQSGVEIPAWHFLGLSVTSEEALWGRIGGYPKVLRKVTFENHANTYIGTSYARDGSTPALKLALELKKRRPTRDEKRFLDFVSPIPGLTIKGGRAINRGAIGGGKYNIYELENVAPQIWNIKFGDCTIEYPTDPNNYLSRLGIGKFITGYWLKQKYRYKIQYREE
jgi:hypothetical protein